MAKIFIDPGHNPTGADTGATGFGLKEQDISVLIGVKVRDMLVNSGHTVKMSRESVGQSTPNLSVNASLADRYNAANSWGADIFVSIHCNASNGQGHGTETYYCSGSTQGAKLAQCVQDSLIKHVGRTNRGVKIANFAVIRHTNMPAILVETAFIDNQSDNATLATDTGRYAYALGISEGVCNYFGTSVNAATPSVESVSAPDPMTQPFTLTAGEYWRIMGVIDAMGSEIATLKTQVALLIEGQGGEMIYNYNDDNIPPYFKESLTAALNCGRVKGDENGLLHLTYKDLVQLEIMYREGHFRPEQEIEATD